MNKDGILRVVNDKGEEKEVHILFTFNLEETGKNYMVYTDYSKNEEGNIRTFSSTYSPNEKKPKLEPVEGEKEKNLINEFLKKLENDIRVNL
jgi:uncharacterized protein YrzB (UPF0473 family)